MVLPIFLIIISFITIMLSATPFLLKPSVVFGVTVPESFTDDSTIISYKKIYAVSIFITGFISFFIYYYWVSNSNLSEETIVLTGLVVQFGLLFLSMVLYFYYHAQTTQLKQKNQWGADLKQVRIAELAIRTKDEMLPSYVYAVPMLITVGLIAYTATQYNNMPDLIPTHWGANGQADTFSEKTPFSVIALLIILLIIQVMMAGINTFTKQSGIRLSAVKRIKSKVQQLLFRKYSSWFLYMMTILMTILFGFIQLATIHDGLGVAALMLALPLGFLLITLLATAIYAFKVGQSGSRIEVEVEDETITGITDLDDDEHWKYGIFYVNRNDPSVFVEKRFGIGWAINFGNPIGYVIIFVPLLLILAISFLL